MRRCLIADKMHPSIIPLLKETGLHPDYFPDITKEEILNVIGDYAGIIVRSKITIDRFFLDKAVNLKFIARAGAGMDQIHTEEVAKKNILIFNAPEGNQDALAEHTIALMLGILNKIHIADRQVRNGVWDREANRGYELKGKYVGIIGFGFMGRAVAEKLSSFGCKILAYDKNLKNYCPPYVRECTLETIKELSDIVSFHIPLNEETKGLVDSQYLNSFRKELWVINTARGEILKLKDLNLLLKNGKIRGAALDVLENEKINHLDAEEKKEFDILAMSEKVLLTPHVGGWTYESYERINEILAEKIKNSGLFNVI